MSEKWEKQFIYFNLSNIEQLHDSIDKSNGRQTISVKYFRGLGGGGLRGHKDLFGVGVFKAESTQRERNLHKWLNFRGLVYAHTCISYMFTTV